MTRLKMFPKITKLNKRTIELKILVEFTCDVV